MARASEKDLEAALAVSRIIEELEKGYMPGQDDDCDLEFFDRDNPRDCQRALAVILDAAEQGSLFRVTFGMAVVLDPRNKLLDANADTLEVHPDHEANARDAARYRWLRARMLGVDFDWADAGITALFFEMPDGMAYGGDCDRNIDAAMSDSAGEGGKC
ncbi:hypothetical protein CAL14_05380 [Bordetella genomosp. 9]|nr:hypothetical protein CAL14_05380 [Bordetella genomosp. 9]